MLFLPVEVASMIEAKLNETQEGQESPFIFRTDTMMGRYTQDFFIDENGEKKEFIYSVITDPVGDILAVPNLGISIQQFDLHIYFKIKYRNQMYQAINTFLNNMTGLFVSIPGTELASGENTKVTFTVNLPYFSEPMNQNIKTVSERSGLVIDETMGFIEAVINIRMVTSSKDILMANEISYTLSINNLSEKLSPTNSFIFGAKINQNQEQYIGESTSKTINSTNALQMHISFFVNGDISNKIFEECASGIEQNEIYQLKIVQNETVLATHNVLLVDPSVTINIGGYSVIETYFVIVDSVLGGGTTNATNN